MKEIEVAIVRWHKDSEASRRLATLPGVGPITASAIVATITDPFQFHSARHLAAWIGPVPRQHSSGGKQRQGGFPNAKQHRSAKLKLRSREPVGERHAR